jgi:hypothetical protein
MEELAEYVTGSAVTRYDHDVSTTDALLAQRVSGNAAYGVRDAPG